MVPIKLGSLIDCAFISTNWLFIFDFANTLGHCSDRLQSFWIKTLLSQIDIKFHFLRLLNSTQIRIFLSFSLNIQIFNHFLEWLTTLNRFWIFFQKSIMIIFFQILQNTFFAQSFWSKIKIAKIFLVNMFNRPLNRMNVNRKNLKNLKFFPLLTCSSFQYSRYTV